MYEMTAKIHEQLGARFKPGSDEFEKAFDKEMETQRQRVHEARLFLDMPKARFRLLLSDETSGRGESRQLVQREFSSAEPR